MPEIAQKEQSDDSVVIIKFHTNKTVLRKTLFTVEPKLSHSYLYTHKDKHSGYNGQSMFTGR